MPGSTQRQLFDLALPVCGIGCFGDEFEVLGSSYLRSPTVGEQAQAQAQGRRGGLVRGFHGRDFAGEFSVDLLPVVIEVAESRMNFARGKMRVLAEDFLRGPTIAEMVGSDLRDANSRVSLQPGGVTGSAGDVRVVERNHAPCLPRRGRVGEEGMRTKGGGGLAASGAAARSAEPLPQQVCDLVDAHGRHAGGGDPEAKAGCATGADGGVGLAAKI